MLVRTYGEQVLLSKPSKYYSKCTEKGFVDTHQDFTKKPKIVLPT